MKKEAKIEVETSGKIEGYVGGVVEFENGGQKTLGPRKSSPKNFENLILEKSVGNFVSFAKRPWCRRRDGYSFLRNVGKTELRVVIMPPS